MTLEEAQARIVELEEQNTELTNERDTLKTKNDTLTSDLEKVRTLNQKYFEKLTARDTSKEDKPGDKPDVKSCEDFAKELNI